MFALARNAAAFSAALLIMSCAQAPDVEQQSASAAEEPIIVPEDPACEARPAIFVNPAVARQGATMKLVVQEPVGAYAPREIFPQLITGWTASPVGLVAIAKDGGSLTIAENASTSAVHSSAVTLGLVSSASSAAHSSRAAALGCR